MANFETTVWGIHAGRTGDAYTLFVKNSCVALGWPKLGDLGKIKADREALKARIAEEYPDKKPGAIPNNAGQLFRFVHEMKIGDIIVYPSKHDRHVHIGRIEGPYKYEPRQSESYPNTRSVKWLKILPRTSFTQGALYEIGSALSFFQVKTYGEEFRAALEGKVVPQPAATDDTVAVVAEGIEQATQDFILKRLSQELKGHPLADFVAHLLGTMGYRTRVSPEGPDDGVDIIAHKDKLGFEPPVIKVQVKSGDNNVSDPDVSALYGKVSSGEHGLFVTLAGFTPKASAFAKSKSNLRLINGDELVRLILEHYDQFDSRYKGLLPLKRVFVPESIEAAGDAE